MSAIQEDTKWYSYTSSTQTMRTWARRIETSADVPQIFQAAFPEHHDRFPYTIFIPEDKFTKAYKRNHKLICVFEDHFTLLESLPNEIVSQTAQFTDVLCLQRGMILLNSWLQITTNAGVFEVSFNTTNEHLFKPIIATLRQGQASWDAGNEKISRKARPDLAQFDFLDKANYKFMNYGIASVRPQDQVLGLIYQPELTLKNIQFFNKSFFRQYKTAHLTILTDKELIFVQEDKQIRTNFDPKHGGVFTHIPRRQIQNVTFVTQAQPQTPACLMTITLPNDTHLTAEFSPDNDGLHRFQALFH